MAGCRPKPALSPPPSSIESLCLVNGSVAKIKVPAIDLQRTDRLAKAPDLHVDIEAASRIALAATHETGAPPLDENAVRLRVTEAGGGIIAWWRNKPVVLDYATDAKAKAEPQDVYAIAIPEVGHTDETRVLYLLSKPAGASAAPRWQAVETADGEHVCM